MKKFSLIFLILSLIFLSSCRDTDVFGDYSIKYDYYEIESKDEEENIIETQEPMKETNKPQLIDFTENVICGDEATITIKAIPKTLYSIKVHYTSGVSKSAALVDKISDEKGIVSWTWKVSHNTKPGSFTVNIQTGEDIIISEKIHILKQ